MYPKRKCAMDCITVNEFNLLLIFSKISRIPKLDEYVLVL